MPAENATQRLERLLTLVPWLLSRPGITVEEAARGLGVTEEQLRADLDLLWVCGYGELPDELIDVDSEDGRIQISNADLIGRPLRLVLDEAITLMVGLRALAAQPGISEHAAITSALAKLEEATGGLGDAARRVQVAIDEETAADTLARLREALAGHRRVHLRYLVPSRDEVTERDVDPMRLLNLEGHWYLEGWCHRASDVRLFRLDRIEALDVLDVDGTPPADARQRDLGGGTYVAGGGDLAVRVHLEPNARWVRDYYPIEDVVECDDGSLDITIRTGDVAFVERLLLRLGAAARVLGPPEVADRVRDRAAAALARYEGS